MRKHLARLLRYVADQLDTPATRADYLPATVELRLDGRVLSQQVVKHILRKAARGPGSYGSGGPLNPTQ